MRPLLSFQPLRASDVFDLWAEARASVPGPGRRAPWALSHLSARTPLLPSGEEARYELRLANFSGREHTALLNFEIFEIARLGWRRVRRFPLRLTLPGEAGVAALITDDEGGRLGVEIEGRRSEVLADFVSELSPSARGLYAVRCRAESGPWQALHVYQRREVRR